MESEKVFDYFKTTYLIEKRQLKDIGKEGSCNIRSV